ERATAEKVRGEIEGWAHPHITNLRVVPIPPDHADGIRVYAAPQVAAERTITCMICGAALQGALDTFGDAGSEVCQSCWLTPLDLEPGDSPFPAGRAWWGDEV